MSLLRITYAVFTCNRLVYNETKEGTLPTVLQTRDETDSVSRRHHNVLIFLKVVFSLSTFLKEMNIYDKCKQRLGSSVIAQPLSQVGGPGVT